MPQLYLLAALLILTPTYSQEPSTVTPSLQQGGTIDPKLYESEILSKLHLSNMLAMEAGKLAQANGQAAKVRSYGKRLERDRRLADQLISSFARERQILLGSVVPHDPQEVSMFQQQRTSLERLRGLQGAQFDLEFLKTMEASHNQTAQMIRTAHDAVGTEELKDLLGRLLPIIRQHEQLATHLERGSIGKG